MRLLLTFLCCFTLSNVTAATLYLTRHYEKADTHSPGLTKEGKQRAINLADYLKDKSVGRIYSTAYRRTLETSTPTSNATGVDITVYPADDLATLANKLRHTSTPTVIVGHSNTTPQLIKMLGGPDVTIHEHDYGTLYELTLNPDGLTFKETLIPKNLRE